MTAWKHDKPDWIAHNPEIDQLYPRSNLFRSPHLPRLLI